MTKGRQIPQQIVNAVTRWPVDSQLRSRRNALVASTALTQRRRETLEVEAFLAASRARHDARVGRTAALR
jgi:hypothetical protein